MDAGPAVRVARTVAQVEELRPLWDRLEVVDMDADIDYFLAVVGASPTVESPYVVVVDRGAEPPLLVVARLVRESFPLKAGYRTLATARARTAVIAFDGFLGCRTEQEVATALDALLACLAADGVHVVLAQKVPLDSPAGRVLARTNAAWRRKRREVMPLWTADLPESWDALLAARSSRGRQRLRQADAKLRKTYGDRLVLRRLDQDPHTERLRRDLAAVAPKSYQHGLGVSIVGDPVQTALIALAVEKGWLRVWMLYLDDQPVSFWWGIAYRGVLTTMTPGYLPELAGDRVGTFTLCRMIEDACLDPEVATLNFGPGDAEYKERFASSSVEVADVLLFGARPGALGVSAVVRLNERANRTGRALLAWSGRREALRARLRSTRATANGGASSGR